MICTEVIIIGNVQFDIGRENLKTRLRQAQLSGFDNGNEMMWRLKEGYNIHEEPLEEAVEYFISVLEQGQPIHPFLEMPGFPKYFLSVLPILLINFTKYGLYNMKSAKEIRLDPKKLDESLSLSFDFGTLLNDSSSYFLAHSVMLRQYGYNFITCSGSGVHFKNKINAFIRPYDWITWTCVVITIAFIVAFTSPKNIVDSFMYTFGALTEQSVPAFVNVFRKKMV